MTDQVWTTDDEGNMVRVDTEDNGYEHVAIVVSKGLLGYIREHGILEREPGTMGAVKFD
jgi:hypothetical protein